MNCKTYLKKEGSFLAQALSRLLFLVVFSFQKREGWFFYKENRIAWRFEGLLAIKRH